MYSEGSDSFGEPSGQSSFDTPSGSEAQSQGYDSTGFGGGLSTAKGGFIKKPKAKAKRMKRGGLASR